MSMKIKKEKSTPVLNAIRHICLNLLLLCTPSFTKECRFHVTIVLIRRALWNYFEIMKRTTMKDRISLIATVVITKAREEISANMLNRNIDQNGSAVKLASTPQQGPQIWGTTLKECMEILFSIVMNANISAIQLVHCKVIRNIDIQIFCFPAKNATLSRPVRDLCVTTIFPNIRTPSKNATNVERCFTVCDILEYIRWTNTRE